MGNILPADSMAKNNTYFKNKNNSKPKCDQDVKL